MLKIYNTLARRKQDFVPIEPGRVRMYVCGITVYDLCHVGHDFVMLTEGVSFPEAVERLAEQAGMPLPKYSEADARRDERRKTLIDIVELAAKFFEAALASRAGARARGYLADRGIDAATALTHPERHVLTKGLGMGVDMKPELTETPVTPHDLIMLCSDGLTKMLEDSAIASVLSRANGDPHRACHDLIEQALSRGGEDNVTVIVVAYHQ